MLSSINWWGVGSAYTENPAIGWLLLNFLVFAGFLVYFLRKPVQAYFEGRSLGIKNAIEEARLAKEHSQNQLSQCEARLLKLDAEIAQIKSDFAHQGEMEKKRLQEEAVQMAERMAKESEEIIRAEISRAIHRLKVELVDQILLNTQANLSLSSERDTQLCAAFVQDTQEAPL